MSYGEEPDVTGIPGVHIEVKRVERLNVSQAMAQAVRDAEKFNDGAPALFHRRSREPWLVTMRLSDWLEMSDKKREPPKRPPVVVDGSGETIIQQGEALCNDHK